MPATSLDANELDPSPRAYVAFLWPLSFFLRKLQLMAPLSAFPSPLTVGRLQLLERQMFVFELHGSSLLPVILSRCVCIKGNKRNPSQNYFSSMDANKIYEGKKKGCNSVTLIPVMNEETRGRLGKAFIHPSPTHSFITHSSKFRNYWGSDMMPQIYILKIN